MLMVTKKLMQKCYNENSKDLKITIDDEQIRCTSESFVLSMTQLYFGEALDLQEFVFEL